MPSQSPQTGSQCWFPDWHREGPAPGRVVFNNQGGQAALQRPWRYGKYLGVEDVGKMQRQQLCILRKLTVNTVQMQWCINIIINRSVCQLKLQMWGLNLSLVFRVLYCLFSKVIGKSLWIKADSPQPHSLTSFMHAGSRSYSSTTVILQKIKCGTVIFFYLLPESAIKMYYRFHRGVHHI